MVNINNVYQTVLTIINKENRGYVTPDEFNHLANIAQLEIFESYFVKAVQVAQADVTADDGANPMMVNAEKIAIFHSTARTPVPNEPRDNDIMFANGIFPYPSDFYRLETVTVNGIIADQVSHKDVRYITLSPLTHPVASQPVFTRNAGGVTLYTNTVRAIEIDYLRQPLEPRWAFVIDPMMNDGMPVYNSAASQNFELHPSEEQDLVYKILSLAGVVIRDAEVQGVGTGKEQQVQATEQ